MIGISPIFRALLGTVLLACSINVFAESPTQLAAFEAPLPGDTPAAAEPTRPPRKPAAAKASRQQAKGAKQSASRHGSAKAQTGKHAVAKKRAYHKAAKHSGAAASKNSKKSEKKR